MKTALVFGGTRFFGVDLVNSLLEKGIMVTIATRQQSSDPFGDTVERLKLDRFDEDSVRQAVEGKQWDAAFDQICYSSEDAKITVDALEGKVKRYIFTSTLSVYDEGEDLSEEQFDPYTYKLKMVNRQDVSYKEGKRQAEAYFYQKASFPVTAVRIPIVMGEEDYTGRLLHYIHQVKEGKPIYLPNPNAEMVFIHQQEAGDFLAWIADTDFTGPINASATGKISLKALIELIGEEVGKEIHVTTDDEHESPYGIKNSWFLSNEKAANLGYSFTKLEDWLPKLVSELS
ncbi:NAD-dependent epimerase/dehydratase family protein [Bacillus marinisedimentorum]|uniref:NAD-dependent epimerase/dehydratase family protein n=1 Tax=Bacillus marinisedimentorum TaxID=1821260 RepID=UPI0008734020|nr:NAD-dependent epimerase/dehydratase family protein [Bacillus marinisedimentorum]